MKLGLDFSNQLCYIILAPNKKGKFPGVAQLVARLTGGQEAAGSSPVTRTIQHNRLSVMLMFFQIEYGGVAQLVRAFGSHPRGHGFEPPRLHHKKESFVYQTKDSFFELSVPCGTISKPSVREAMLCIVKCLRAWVAHLTSLRA